ncbi:MAG: ferredoxin--NADP(+) reductase [Caulobacter vibrioides]|uniref:ferredoxin--NADP(+) reductase n=1 Tax=Caulobacter vibrioides TaxID=155892 RepID=A0A258D9J6_CAUVI|nr:MAG: ferredoxin--NADP(+) reductase [Caulobacter vibrioides]
MKEAPYFVEKVLWVKHWTDRLFSFAITRPASFRFRSGEFVMIGLPPREELGEKKPILRAYSIGSPSFAEELEFFSIKVPDGPLTSRLQLIQEGDEILLGKKPTGTLVLDAVRPGKRLFLFGTGTGLAPWLSVAYRDLFTQDIFDDPLVGDEARAQLTYYPTVTREPFERQGRFTDLITSGKLFSDLGIDGDKFDPENDRAMLCGSMAMIKDTAALLEAHGLKEGSNAEPGDFVIERAFVG